MHVQEWCGMPCDCTDQVHRSGSELRPILGTERPRPAGQCIDRCDHLLRLQLVHAPEVTERTYAGKARAALDIEAASRHDYTIRVGIHAGEVFRSEGDLLGITVNKAARIASAAEGGQILASSLVTELVGPMTDVAYGTPERITLKGLSGTHTVVAIEPHPRA